MNENTEPADRLSEFLDGQPPADQTPADQPSGLEKMPPVELAKHLFVSGVVKHLLAENDGHMDRQIGRTMATIEALQTRRLSMRRWLSWSLTAAAMVLIAFVVALQQPEDLMATVDRVVQAVQDENIDREFLLRIQDDDPPPWTDLVGEPRELRLFVRGTGKLLIKIKNRLGDFAVGLDSEEAFAVVPEDLLEHLPMRLPFPLPVFVVRDQTRTEQFADQWGLMKEAFQLANILKRLRIDYDIALTRDSNQPLELIDFTGRRRDDAPWRRPEYIRIVADRRTAKLHKVVLTWGPDRPLGAPNLALFNLVEEKRLPDTFYRHAAHHEPDRRVREFGR